MRLAIFIVLFALATSAHGASWFAMAFAMESKTISSSVSGPGWYSDPKLIVKYPLQAGLNLYKITTYKYWF